MVTIPQINTNLYSEECVDYNLSYRLETILSKDHNSFCGRMKTHGNSDLPLLNLNVKATKMKCLTQFFGVHGI